MMLTQLGYDDSRKQIQTRWNELVSLANEFAPHRYDLAYPKLLLEKLTSFFREKCVELGMFPYNANDPKGLPMATAINECWTDFRSEPDKYASVERQRIEELLMTIREA